MRIAIADDATLWRDGLVRLLQEAGAEVVVEASSGPALLAAITRNVPDVAILDLGMPPGVKDGGLTTAAELRALHPNVGILVLSQYNDASYAERLFEIGPRSVGYLLKDTVTDVATLMRELGRIVEGDSVIDHAIVTRLMGARSRAGELDSLTDREREILRLMAEGLTNRGIARHVHLGERTIEAHVTSIFAKLGISQTTDENPRVRAVLAFLRSTSKAI